MKERQAALSSVLPSRGLTVRSKIWLSAVLIAVLVSVASWIRLQVTRLSVWADEQAAAEASAREIANDIKTLDYDPDDREIEERLVRYRYNNNIVRLEVLVDRPASSTRIVAPRGERPEITRLAPYERVPLGFSKQGARDPSALSVEMQIEPRGPWRATLSMRWSLASVDKVLRTEERVSLIFGVGSVVALLLLSGLITDRIVGRPLDKLARAMRDVEQGDLSRRVVVESNDEFGRVSQGFNEMLQRLGEADAEIRAFNQRLAREIEGATQDLSEKNATLEQLNRLLEEMRQENASKVRLAALGELAAQLAHEIGTPLSSISGHVQLALAQVQLAPALRERLDVIRRESERISRIVRTYLDSTRPLDPERRPTMLPRLVDEAVEVCRGVDARDRASVTVEIDPRVAEVTTDPGLLRQILINLISNALDACGPGGLVSIAATPKEPDEVVIMVRDTGQGIGVEDLKRIFEPFYTTKGRGKGTGLGLAICRQLTASLGGAISVESAPGAGSVFSVQLPRRGAPQRLPDRMAG